MASLEFVDVETARNAPGIRLVMLAGVPSPWSQAAKAIFEYKRIPARAVLMSSKDEAVRSWTGISNAPVVMFEKEAPRAGWAEILGLAERLRPDLPLIPAAPRGRVLHQGLCVETLGEGGLAWNARLLTIDASLTSDGVEGFPLPIARYLGKRYGHTTGCSARARARVLEVFDLLSAQLEAGGGRYFFGELSALDFYVASLLNIIVPLPHEQCPMHPLARVGFEWLQRTLGDTIPTRLIAHRDQMYATQISLPIQF